MFTLKKRPITASRPKNDYQTEKAAGLAALFLLAFGLGLLVDGKKLYARQLRLAQRIDYRSTLNPYTN